MKVSVSPTPVAPIIKQELELHDGTYFGAIRGFVDVVVIKAYREFFVFKAGSNPIRFPEDAGNRSFFTGRKADVTMNVTLL